ncbi:hypothetical protein [Jiella avicenniae]|uniref:Uncharacterized protein n=1 Tax=Jiella avicenniae TaxID=2907202 RepID=A0A9X1P674_9HYPH|nr:hypothetical protein [Jiella avicenniae]MCE7030574.1 hypothetical protein [Jiella avicenniae]
MLSRIGVFGFLSGVALAATTGIVPSADFGAIIANVLQGAVGSSLFDLADKSGGPLGKAILGRNTGIDSNQAR